MKNAKYEISLKNVHDIRALVYSVTDHNIDGTFEGASTIVKANSILGLFTLDLSCPHVLSVNAKEDSNIAAFEKAMKEQNIALARC